jgi:glutamine---fructose-6-phosphate transaminase (isomerizing)
MSITATEVYSQPAVWARALECAGSAGQFFGPPGERVLFIGCGTSAFVARSLATLREDASLGVSDYAYASEWKPTRSYDRVVAISRSGTTTEVIEALRRVGPSTARVAITGVEQQPIDRVVDAALVLDFADEQSVVQTRFPTSVLLLARAVFGADVTGLPAEAEQELSRPLGIPVEAFDQFVYLGSDWTLGLAEEAALKIREAAQAWSESYPMFDFRHGPISLAGPRSLIFMFGNADERLVAEVERTGARVETSRADPLAQLVRAQRIALAVAESRGLTPDTPRHLTRSVVLS